MTNPTGNSGQISISAVATSLPITDCQLTLVNAVASADGPRLFVPATANVHITFPQAFVTAAVSGGLVCLGSGGLGEVILP